MWIMINTLKKPYAGLKDFKENIAELQGPYNYEETAVYLDELHDNTQVIVKAVAPDYAVITQFYKTMSQEILNLCLEKAKVG